MSLVLTTGFLVTALAINAVIFYLATTEVFSVQFGSGIWVFAVLAHLLAFLGVLWVSTNLAHSFRMRAFFITAMVILSATLAVLGMRFRPFDPSNITLKLGNDPTDPYGLEGIKFSDLPPPKPEVDYEPFLSATLDQGTCGSCWAVSSAGAMSARITMMQSRNAQGQPDPGNISSVSKFACRSGTKDVGRWHISPQALVDLDDWRNDGRSGKCNDSFYTQGFFLAAQHGAPTGSCVPLYSADEPNCRLDCGSPRINAFRASMGRNIDMCIQAESGFKYTSCPESKFGETAAVRIPDRVYRISDEETLKRELSEHGPVMCSLNFYRKQNGALPAWTLVGGNGDTPTNVSPGFVARPSMDGNEYTKEFRDGGHAVVVYGYGVSGTGVPYWAVQNSWGTRWGNGGLMKIERGVDAWNIESLCAAGRFSG